MASDVVNLGPGFRYTRYNVVNLRPGFRYTRYNVVNIGPGFRYTRYNVVNLDPGFRYTRYSVVNLGPGFRYTNMLQGLNWLMGFQLLVIGSPMTIYKQTIQSLHRFPYTRKDHIL
jgi:hypothetical protein